MDVVCCFFDNFLKNFLVVSILDRDFWGWVVFGGGCLVGIVMLFCGLLLMLILFFFFLFISVEFLFGNEYWFKIGVFFFDVLFSVGFYFGEYVVKGCWVYFILYNGVDFC